MRNKYGYVPKKRNSNTRKRKSIMLIVAEGENRTETNYFRSFPSEKYRIKFVSGNDTDPIKMMKNLKQQFSSLGLSSSNGDVGVSLIDTDCDVSKDIQIRSADELATKEVLQIVSSPCFELWLLLHFSWSTRQFSSSNEVVASLKKELPTYSKNCEAVLGQTFERIDTAILNAKKLEEHCLGNGGAPHTVGFTPSSEVYKVVERLLG